MSYLRFLNHKILQELAKINNIKRNVSNLHERLLELHEGRIDPFYMIKGFETYTQNINIFNNCSNELKENLKKAFQINDNKVNIMNLSSKDCEVKNFDTRTIEIICLKLFLKKLNQKEFGEYVKFFGYSFLKNFTLKELKDLFKENSKISKKKFLEKFGVFDEKIFKKKELEKFNIFEENNIQEIQIKVLEPTKDLIQF